MTHRKLLNAKLVKTGCQLTDVVSQFQDVAQELNDVVMQIVEEEDVELAKKRKSKSGDKGKNKEKAEPQTRGMVMREILEETKDTPMSRKEMAGELQERFGGKSKNAAQAYITNNCLELLHALDFVTKTDDEKYEYML